MADILLMTSSLLGYTIHIHGLAQDCSNSSADALELPQSCPKPLIWHLYHVCYTRGHPILILPAPRVSKLDFLVSDCCLLSGEIAENCVAKFIGAQSQYKNHLSKKWDTPY